MITPIKSWFKKASKSCRNLKNHPKSIATSILGILLIAAGIFCFSIGTLGGAGIALTSIGGFLFAVTAIIKLTDNPAFNVETPDEEALRYIKLKNATDALNSREHQTQPKNSSKAVSGTASGTVWASSPPENKPSNTMYSTAQWKQQESAIRSQVRKDSSEYTEDYSGSRNGPFTTGYYTKTHPSLAP